MLSLCSFLVTTKILWKSFWIPSQVKSLSKVIYLFIEVEEEYLQYSCIDLDEWSMIFQELKTKPTTTKKPTPKTPPTKTEKQTLNVG